MLKKVFEKQLRKKLKKEKKGQGRLACSRLASGLLAEAGRASIPSSLPSIARGQQRLPSPWLDAGRPWPPRGSHAVLCQYLVSHKDRQRARLALLSHLRLSSLALVISLAPAPRRQHRRLAIAAELSSSLPATPSTKARSQGHHSLPLPRLRPVLALNHPGMPHPGHQSSPERAQTPTSFWLAQTTPFSCSLPLFFTCIWSTVT